MFDRAGGSDSDAATAAFEAAEAERLRLLKAEKDSEQNFEFQELARRRAEKHGRQLDTPAAESQPVAARFDRTSLCKHTRRIFLPTL